MADNIRVLLTEEEVNKRISEVAAQINKDYEGRPVHLICILKGGVFFTCELAKRLDLSVSLDFMSVSSYGSGTESSGIVKIVKQPEEHRAVHPVGQAGAQGEEAGSGEIHLLYDSGRVRSGLRTGL